MRRRVHIVVSGKVQGVCYRASARDQAVVLGLTGWVRNRADGGVEILAEGGKAEVAAFIDWCRQGPRWARVDGLVLDDEPPKGEFAGFTVLRDG